MSITAIFGMGVYAPDNDYGQVDDHNRPNNFTYSSPSSRCLPSKHAGLRCWRRRDGSIRGSSN